MNSSVMTRLGAMTSVIVAKAGVVAVLTSPITWVAFGTVIAYDLYKRKSE